ncbi:MAG: TIGR03943 family protein [Syntrophorhabdales bacterium]|jgi:uncharacterized repeat protein (TIGR03943 family)
MVKDKAAFGWVKGLDVVVLLLWSTALLFLLKGGRYTHFLRPALGICLAAALFTSLVFCIAVAKVRHYREEASPFVAFIRAAVLILPLVYVIAAGNSVLDSQAFATRWVAPAHTTDSPGESGQPQDVSRAQDEGYDKELVEMFKSYRPKKLSPTLRKTLGLPPDDQQSELGEAGAKTDAFAATLVDLAEYSDRYRGRHITTDGMVAWDKENKSRFYLFRFVIVCCVADAKPAAVLIECPEAERPAPNAWVRAEGLADTIKVDGQTGVIIRNASLAPIPVPKDSYLY